MSVNPTTIKRAFLIETLYPEGGIYKHCSLERLDILQRIEDRYYIEDKVFKMWLDLRKTGELGESPRDKPVEFYLKIPERKYK